MKDSLELWIDLKERYDHLKKIKFSKARYKWIHFQLHDFKIIYDYNYVVYKITSQLKLCWNDIKDDNMLKRLQVFSCLKYDITTTISLRRI